MSEVASAYRRMIGEELLKALGRILRKLEKNPGYLEELTKGERGLLKAALGPNWEERFK